MLRCPFRAAIITEPRKSKSQPERKLVVRLHNDLSESPETAEPVGVALRNPKCKKTRTKLDGRENPYQTYA